MTYDGARAHRQTHRQHALKSIIAQLDELERQLHMITLPADVEERQQMEVTDQRIAQARSTARSALHRSTRSSRNTGGRHERAASSSD